MFTHRAEFERGLRDLRLALALALHPSLSLPALSTGAYDAAPDRTRTAATWLSSDAW